MPKNDGKKQASLVQKSIVMHLKYALAYIWFDARIEMLSLYGREMV